MRQALIVVSLISASTILMPAPRPAIAAQQAAPAAAAADPAGVDTIVELVKGGMPESLVLKTIQKDGKAYNLGPADLLKLQKAGVSEKIIETMLDPSSAPGAPAPAGAAAAVATQPAPAAAPAAAPAKGNAKAADKSEKSDKKSGGVFSGLKGKLKDSAQKTVDGVGNTTESAVDKSVTTGQSKVEDAIPSVDNKKPATATTTTTTGKTSASTAKR